MAESQGEETRRGRRVPMYQGATEHPCSIGRPGRRDSRQGQHSARNDDGRLRPLAQLGSRTSEVTLSRATQLGSVPGSSVVCMGRWPSRRSTSPGD
jgi:hypothetical protein